MSFERQIADLAKRVKILEARSKADNVAFTKGKFKRTAGTITAGDVYVVQNTGNRIIDTTTTESDNGQIVVALESRANAYEWANCVISGQVWVNFKTGLSPSPTDFAITSTTAGKATTSTTSDPNAFGRLIAWDSTNDRGFVVMGTPGGGGGKDWRQSTEPTAIADITNRWYDTDDGHYYVWNHVDEVWVSMTGYN